MKYRCVEKHERLMKANMFTKFLMRFSHLKLMKSLHGRRLHLEGKYLSIDFWKELLILSTKATMRKAQIIRDRRKNMNQ